MCASFTATFAGSLSFAASDPRPSSCYVTSLPFASLEADWIRIMRSPLLPLHTARSLHMRLPNTLLLDNNKIPKHARFQVATRSHFSPNDVQHRYHRHAFSTMRDSELWCLFPTRPTSIFPHADILSATSRSPPVKPILLPFDCGVLSTMRIH